MAALSTRPSKLTTVQYITTRVAQRFRERTVYWQPFAVRNIIKGLLLASSLPVPVVDPADMFPKLRNVLVQVSPLTEGAYPGDSGVEKVALVSAIAKAHAAARLLEIGTCSGFMARHLVVNCGPDSKLWTIDLPDAEADATAFPLRKDDRELVLKSAHGRGLAGWYAAAAPESGQIVQILCDSATYSYDDVETPLDFAYIDGAHSYEYVVNDTVNVLRRIRPGGVIIWDDYYHYFPGIVRAIGELHRIVQVARLARTGMVAAVVP